MTPAAIIREAAADGVSLELSPAGPPPYWDRITSETCSGGYFVACTALTVALLYLQSARRDSAPGLCSEETPGPAARPSAAPSTNVTRGCQAAHNVFAQTNAYRKETASHEV
jgi:hypothetical protein